ncbi:MAG: DUF2460 domain-containing protein [Pseudomonadota bacterium]
MSFHEVRFPTKLSFGSVGGPERRTEVVTLANGFEERNTPWAHPKRRYDAGVGLRAMEDIEALIDFFEARQGKLYGFRWKDWSDFKSCGVSFEVNENDQALAFGDGAQLAFQLVKNYRSGDNIYARPICKPVKGTVIVALDREPQKLGVDFEVEVETGVITFSNPPEVGVAVTAGYEFDVPVRFDTDLIQTSAASFRAGNIPNVPVVEVRV